MINFADELPRETWALVPVKRLSSAKGRLAGVLSAAERARLAQTMLGDVLATLSATPSLAGIVVVSGDAVVHEIAGGYDAVVVDDRTESGVNDAVIAGLDTLDRAASAVIIPSDVPFATVEEIDDVVQWVSRSQIVLVPASSDGGTNALAMKAPDVLVPSFGEDSLIRHKMAALRKGLSFRVMSQPGIGKDIDRTEDLIISQKVLRPTATAALLEEFEMAKRLGASFLPISVRYF